MRYLSRASRRAACTVMAALLLGNSTVRAIETIEFVQEHLAEVAMDNRYATLPLWGQTGSPEDRWTFVSQVAFAQTRTGALTIEGPMISAGASRQIAGDWNLDGFAFFDDLNLTSGTDQRPLEVGFASGVPLSLPEAAAFNDLSGSARSFGLGVAVRRASEMRFLHSFQWTAGLLWHRVELRDYALNFRILEGADAGATGVVNYSGTYSHIAPFGGIAWPREYNHWTVTPHAQAVLPLPRRGVVGEISGSGYDLRGDTGKTGVGTPFGDPSVTLGLDITYKPWHVTFDVGSTISQALVEPFIHQGIDSNWLISASWNF